MTKFPKLTKEVESFYYDYSEFKRDFKLKNYLEEIFDAKYQAVWTTKAVEVDKGLCEWSLCDIIILKNNNKVLLLSNSEWAFFTEGEHLEGV